MQQDSENTAEQLEVPVFTHVKRDGNRWVWHQECYDTIIQGSESKAPEDASPWLVLRFNSIDGENYGRGRVEEFFGDLKSLEGLSQAMVEGSAVAAKVVFTVSPSSTTRPKSFVCRIRRCSCWTRRRLRSQRPRRWRRRRALWRPRVQRCHHQRRRAPRWTPPPQRCLWSVSPSMIPRNGARPRRPRNLPARQNAARRQQADNSVARTQSLASPSF